MSRMTAVISVYNARPSFLEAQVESILSQSVPVTIFIRDDGSTSDATRAQLRRYETREGITVAYGTNLGFEAGFIEALRLASRTDYYAFCDQDDEWLPERARHALELLDQHGAAHMTTPVLYCSRFVECDQDMKVTMRQQKDPYLATFENALTEAIPGMVMILNNALRDLLLMADASQIAGHDWLAYIIAAGAGTIITDNHETVRKRRHEDNVSQGSLSPMRLLAFRLRRFVFGSGLDRLRTMYGECERCYAPLFSEENRDLLLQFTLPNSPGKALKKVTWHRRYRANILDELGVRILFLINRL